MSDRGLRSTPPGALRAARSRARQALLHPVGGGRGVFIGSVEAKNLALAVLALSEALDATWEDVTVLLDQHVSDEVNKEARLRLIERFAALESVDE